MTIVYCKVIWVCCMFGSTSVSMQSKYISISIARWEYYLKSTKCMDAYSYVNYSFVHKIRKVVLCAIVELCNSIRILNPQKLIMRWKTHFSVFVQFKTRKPNVLAILTLPQSNLCFKDSTKVPKVSWNASEDLLVSNLVIPFYFLFLSN